jgi:beta-glucosidase/6-phospho-beta-glucosidase/beta-galactosidase/ABC-type amino acid transport substrate-binding protein
MKDLPSFPAAFRFGVPTADHQCEAFDSHFGPDIRDLWEARQAETPRGNATDFWHRFAGDIKLAQDLGCTAFRISLSWARIEPTAGNFDPAVIAHYRDVLQAIAAAKMMSVVTLHHNVWPVHLEQRGGMVADDFTKWFEAYARRIAADLGDLVTHYVTINEPNQLVFGYVKPWWSRTYAMPPGLQRGADTPEQMHNVAILIRNLFEANKRAYVAIHAEHDLKGIPASVGCNPFLLGLPIWAQRLLDYSATRAKPESFARDNRRLTEPLMHESGDVDLLIAQYTGTTAREDETNFSEAYLVAHRALLVASGTTVPTAQGLCGSIAVVRQSTCAIALPETFPNATPVEVESIGDAVALLRANHVSAVFNDDLILASYASSNSGFKLLLHAAWSGSEPYVAAVAPGNRDLLNAVDCAIKNFKEPAPGGGASPWERAVRTYLAALASDPVPTQWRRANLSDLARATPDRPLAAPGVKWPLAAKGTLLRIVQQRGRVRIGIKPGVLGLCEENNGTYSGFEIDLARFVALQIFGDSTAVEFHPVTTQRRIPILRSPLRLFSPLLRIISIFSTILTTNWWHLGIRGKLPDFLCPKDCVGKQDYVGLDYYWGIRALGLNRVMHLFDASIQRYSLAPVWSSALRGMLVRLTKQFPGLRLIVVENGCVDKADGVARGAYLRDHIHQVQRALSEGCPVDAYMCWSITSNREWGLKFDVDSNFGLYYIDLDNDATLARIAKDDSAAVYQQIIQSRSAT